MSRHFTTPEGITVDASNDYDTLRDLLNPSRIAIIVQPNRSGARSFCTFLEYKYFPPATPMNGHFRYCIVTWEEQRWIVIIIHKKFLPDADKLAKLFGLRRANGALRMAHVSAPGWPPISAVAVTQDPQKAANFFNIPLSQLKTFPLTGPNVWTLEHIEGHFCYENNPELEQKARDFEDRACDNLIAEHEARRRAGEFNHDPGTMPPRRIS